MNTLGIVYHFSEMMLNAVDCTENLIKFYSYPNDDNQTDEINKSKLLHGITLISKCSILALNILQTHILINTGTLSNWALLKTLEILPRFINMPLELWNARRETDIPNASKYEKGLALPVCQFLHTMWASHSLQEERSFKSRVISSTTQIYFNEHLRISDFFAYPSILFRAGIIAKIFTVFEKLLIFRLSLQQGSPSIQTHDEFRTQIDYEPFKLTEKSFIPDNFADDLLFRHFICTISQSPALEPVIDPTNGITVYDFYQIQTWLKDNCTSPITRRPLMIDVIKKQTPLKKLINERLEFHQNRILKCIEEGLKIPLSDEQQINFEKVYLKK